MKNFLTTWLMVMVLGVVAFFFLGGLLLNSFWAVFLLITAGIAALITAGVSLSDRLDELSAKVDALTPPADATPAETKD